MKKILTTIFSLCFLSFALFAQNKQISGIVVDAQGEGVIGAAVMVVGTTIGTATNYDGTFTLNVPADAKTLNVTAIGYEAQDVAIADNLRIVLKEHSEQLEEVTIQVPYGTAVKGTFAGSAQAVDAKTIETKSPTEVSKALAGEIAGVQVINSSGQPGTNASIRIRGVGSVLSSSAPLYIVDGMPYDGDLSAIDPSDIASTTVLKDATATSLYGSRGANGVILITTKHGTSGEQGKIDVDVKYGANMHLLPLYDVISSPEEYVELSWMGIYNSMYLAYTSENSRVRNTNNNLFSSKGISPAYNLWEQDGNQLIDGSTGRFYPDIVRKNQFKNMASWEDAIFRVGQKAEATVKISGGSDKTTYYTSFGYLKDEGYYIGSDYDRVNVRSNIQHQAKPWLKGSLNMAYSYSSLNMAGQEDDAMNNGFLYVNECPPIYPVYLYDENGNIQIDPKTHEMAFDYGINEGQGRGYGANINPAGSLRYDRYKQEQHNLSGTANLEFKLYKDLKFELNAGVQYVGLTESALTNPYYGDAAGMGRIAKGQSNLLTINFNQLLKYNKNLDKHNISALAGHEIHYLKNFAMVGHKSKLGVPSSLELSNAVQMTSLGSNTTTYSLDSYFANVQYTYDERYLFTANYRADGSSRFAKGHRWGHFGSVGAAWLFTNESFMDPVKDYLKNGKLRVSWGMLGNQEVAQFRYEDRYSINYVNGQVGFIWELKGNPDLTWESSQIYDLGLEFSVMKYLDVEIDYFYKLTNNMLFPYYVAPSLGYSYFYFNGGEMMNQGVELQLNAHAVDTRNIKLDIRFNGSHYQNKVLSLPADLENSGAYAVGYSPFDYQLVEYMGVNPEDGTALYKAYYDAKLGSFGRANNATTLRDENMTGANYITNKHVYEQDHKNDCDVRDTIISDYQYCGTDFIKGYRALPSFAGGFGVDLEVYGVTISATCSYQLGGHGYDNVYARLMSSDRAGRVNWHTDIRNAWNYMMTDEQKQHATVPRLSNGDDLYANSVSTRFLTKNNYISLNNVKIGYSFPKKLIEKIKLNYLQIWVSGDNLAIATARRGYNPTVSMLGTSSSSQYTPLSTIMGGIKFQF